MTLMTTDVTSRFILVGVIILVLIVSPIGGVEVGIESVVTTQTLTPVVGVFPDHLVATSATLRVIVVGRDADHIGRIDLEDHGLASVAVTEVRQVVDGAEVQTSGASEILVIAHRISTHLTDLTYGVVELARVNVRVVGTNILEGKEVTILGNGELTHIQEGVEFLHGTIARILHEIDHEVEQRLNREILLHELNHTLGESVVDDFSVEGDCPIVDFDGLTPELVKVVLDLSGEIHEIVELAVIFSLDCLKCLGVVGMGLVDCVDLSFDESRDCSASSDCDGWCIH
jgi:hypothetical protein